MNISDQTRARTSASRVAGSGYRRERTSTPDFLPGVTDPQLAQDEIQSHSLHEREDTPEPESSVERGLDYQMDTSSDQSSSSVITDEDIRIVNLPSINCLYVEEDEKSSSRGLLLPGEQFEEWVLHYLALRENASTFSVFMAALKTHLMCLGQRPYVPLDKWFKLSLRERLEWIWIVKMAKVAFLYDLNYWKRDDPWLIEICLRTWKIRAMSPSAFVLPLAGDIEGVILPPIEVMSTSLSHQVPVQPNYTKSHREMVYQEYHCLGENLMDVDR